MIILASKATIMTLLAIVVVGMVIVTIAAASLGCGGFGRRYDRYYDRPERRNNKEGRTSKTMKK